jgi:transcriptional regulator with XRE-family HTH domain
MIAMEKQRTHTEDGRTRLAANVDRLASGVNEGGLETLAIVLGMNRTTLYNWRRDTRLPKTIDMLWRIADHAGCTIDSLVGREGDFNPISRAAPIDGVAEIMAAVAEVLAEVRKMAGRIQDRRDPALILRAGGPGVETAKVAVGGGFTTIACDVCQGRVTLPDSAPSHDLTAAIERFRRKHESCPNGQEISP